MDDKNKCNHSRCDEPEVLGCYKIPGCEFQHCKYWKEANAKSSTKKIKDDNIEKEIQEDVIVKTDTNSVNWTGNSMGLNNLWVIKKRSVPIVIGVIGLFNSGKTTFLSMLYLLLASGRKIGDFRFSGSYTLMGWENISWSMRWNKTGQFSFPDHTSSDMGRNQGYLHLSLKKDGILRDIIFTDVPGEWFANWMRDIEQKESEGANRIVKEADGFLFFVDCEGMKYSNPDRTLIRQNTQTLASRLSSHLNDRPIATLWSKADTKGEIREKILSKLDDKLKHSLPNSSFFNISYQEGENQKYHQNILDCVDWIIERLEQVPRPAIEIDALEETHDYFLNYRGR